MDILRGEAEQLLQELPTASPDARFETISITSRTNDDRSPVVFCETSLNAAELTSFVKGTNSSPELRSLRLVKFRWTPIVGVKSLPSILGHVWHSFNLDPYLMYMVSANVPGFFQLPDASAASPSVCYYINALSHWLMWTHNATNFSTNAVIISRATQGGLAAWPKLQGQLKRYCSFAHHPLFFGVVTAIEKITYVDMFHKEQVRRIGSVEKHTGFSHFHVDKPRPPVEEPQKELERLSDLSRIASSALVGLADMTQHLKNSRAILDVILGSNSTSGLPVDDSVAKRDREIKDVANLLRPQYEHRLEYLAYTRGRAENQLSVIFNLLTRGDAQANIDISQAVRRDSTSMKTVAIMTMGFLPATFLAALFSIPSLHWDQPTVIGSGFWIYWVVTIPTTISVFAVWFAILHWDGLMAMGVRKTSVTSQQVNRQRGKMSGTR